ncbi:hypothetical protein EG328_011124 [Venturia inaequalis]|uniref:Uncharacterized protein n=1 Tax=Venturia inaequalis TaxID=5025 RepID=A0A8H3U5Y0_VENIN|nr:hypothetical protein EG328_011124 [Venturia inaequalis]
MPGARSGTAGFAIVWLTLAPELPNKRPGTWYLQEQSTIVTLISNHTAAGADEVAASGTEVASISIGSRISAPAKDRAYTMLSCDK